MVPELQGQMGRPLGICVNEILSNAHAPVEVCIWTVTKDRTLKFSLGLAVTSNTNVQCTGE